MERTGCLLCGEELLYFDNYKKETCSLCGQLFDSNVHCKSGHFICDDCHSLDANGMIVKKCLQYQGVDPIFLADEIMNAEQIKMHGPEHHLLVPAVLISCYYHAINKAELIPAKLEIARKRAKAILGGFCGFYGTCGAGMGTGLFLSIITETKPTSTRDWGLCNLMTAESLKSIARYDGPRCCKRDVFLALKTAIEFIREKFGVSLPAQKTACTFYPMNRECLSGECEFFPV